MKWLWGLLSEKLHISAMQDKHDRLIEKHHGQRNRIMFLAKRMKFVESAMQPKIQFLKFKGGRTGVSELIFVDQADISMVSQGECIPSPQDKDSRGHENYRTIITLKNGSWFGVFGVLDFVLDYVQGNRDAVYLPGDFTPSDYPGHDDYMDHRGAMTRPILDE